MTQGKINVIINPTKIVGIRIMKDFFVNLYMLYTDMAFYMTIGLIMVFIIKIFINPEVISKYLGGNLYKSVACIRYRRALAALFLQRSAYRDRDKKERRGVRRYRVLSYFDAYGRRGQFNSHIRNDGAFHGAVQSGIGFYIRNCQRHRRR